MWCRKPQGTSHLTNARHKPKEDECVCYAKETLGKKGATWLGWDTSTHVLSPSENSPSTLSRVRQSVKGVTECFSVFPECK